MRGKIISYFDMCQQEKASLQRGMNFRLHGRHSVLLMSVRKGAPYRDRVEDDGATLIYEGHDQQKSPSVDPKAIDQPLRRPGGGLSENGKFFDAAQSHKQHGKKPDLVRVYEKINKGLWADNGYFHLVNSWTESDGRRNVFKFRLEAIEADEGNLPSEDDTDAYEKPRNRVIPSHIKQEVWKRDGGRCVLCGSPDELHFDHVLPYSKGGTSVTAKNVQLLCARHNLQKSAKSSDFLTMN